MQAKHKNTGRWEGEKPCLSHSQVHLAAKKCGPVTVTTGHLSDHQGARARPICFCCGAVDPKYGVHDSSSTNMRMRNKKNKNKTNCARASKVNDLGRRRQATGFPASVETCGGHSGGGQLPVAR
jgi:hypothetical protein